MGKAVPIFLMTQRTNGKYMEKRLERGIQKTRQKKCKHQRQGKGPLPTATYVSGGQWHF